MPANEVFSANEVSLAAVAWLRGRLPQSWDVGTAPPLELPKTAGFAETAIDLRGSDGSLTTMVVEARRTFGPRDVEKLVSGVGRTLRALAGHIPLLVVAPWLSRRTQELLAAEGLNYLDLTGNSLIRLEDPTVYIETQGAAKDPSPPPRNKARVQGPKAGRLLRLLVDVCPPYGVRELASYAQLSIGYVSRILDALDDEALVERSQRGRVESVEVPRLVRRWAETYDVFRTNRTQRYLAPEGASKALARISSATSRTAVTGSFAAVRLAPVAAPALLTIYTDTPDDLRLALGLIPADQGANVALLTPFDPVIWDRTSTADGISFVAPSQIAVDCLTGNGRMPAEGEAVLQWMATDLRTWRLPALPKPAEP